MTDSLDVTDLAHLRRAIDLSVAAREHGNHPFGALLVTGDGRVIEAENTVLTDRDVTGHAEKTLFDGCGRRWMPLSCRHPLCSRRANPAPCAAGRSSGRASAASCTPCRVPGLIDIAGERDDGAALDLPSRDVFAHGGRAIAVSGPHLEDEAAEPHRGFWG